MRNVDLEENIQKSALNEITEKIFYRITFKKTHTNLNNKMKISLTETR